MECGFHFHVISNISRLAWCAVLEKGNHGAGKTQRKCSERNAKEAVWNCDNCVIWI